MLIWTCWFVASLCVNYTISYTSLLTSRLDHQIRGIDNTQYCWPDPTCKHKIYVKSSSGAGAAKVFSVCSYRLKVTKHPTQRFRHHREATSADWWWWSRLFSYCQIKFQKDQKLMCENLEPPLKDGLSLRLHNGVSVMMALSIFIYTVTWFGLSH